MGTQWDDKSWQKDFLNMKSHSPADAKLLMGGVKGIKNAWRLGVLHVEYERLKKISRGATVGSFYRIHLWVIRNDLVPSIN